MRKVLFKRWIEAIELETTKGKSVQSWDREYKEGTNCWSDFIHEGVFHAFMLNHGPSGEPYALIESNGEMNEVDARHIRFSDTPEAEQRSEFAKAAMQGLTSRYDSLHWEDGEFARVAVNLADALISRLKK